MRDLIKEAMIPLMTELMSCTRGFKCQDLDIRKLKDYNTLNESDIREMSRQIPEI